MLILHAGIHDDSFVLWAESSSADIQQMPGYKKPYYLAANTSQLRRVLRQIGIPAAKIVPANIFLPVSGNVPIPSNDLLLESVSTPNSSRTTSEPLMVNVAVFKTRDVANLLGRVFGKRVLSHGVIVGADLAYLAVVMRLSASLVARQQYLPDVDIQYEEYMSKWNPVITGTDLELFEDLVERMPLSTLAFSYTHDTISNELLSRALRDIISLFIGILIKTAMSVDVPLRPRKKFDSAHDSWIYNLQAPKPNSISGRNTQQLIQQIREWQRPIKVTTDMPLRLCFRLEEPENPNDLWFVRYMLQSRDDPSFLVSVEDAWNNDSDILPADMGSREFIMISLGHASEIFSHIASSSKTSSGVAGCQINSEEARDFLARDSISLRQAGYGVIFPSWWTGKGTLAKLRVRAKVKRPRSDGTGMFTLDNIVRFDWEVSLGDEKVTFEELEALAKAKVPLVQMRGQWTEVSPEEIGQAIKFLKKRSKKSSLLDAIMMNLGGALGADTKELDTMQKLDIEIDSEDETISQILDGFHDNNRLEQKDQPKGFEGTLRPYQLQGFSWMWFLQRLGLGGCLADDMGLGKTIQVLALIEEYQNNDKKGPFLLVCPTSVITNWQRETARFTPNLSILIHHGGKRSKNKPALKKEAKKCDILVTSYGLLHRDLDIIKSVKWDGIILDEAQNIKSYNTKQAQAARRIKAKSKFALTGTPVENNIGDMWSIMEFLNPGLLGNNASFRRNFYIPIQTTQSEQAIERLRRVTKPFILRRLKTDKSIISDLPEKIEAKEYCKLTKEQASLYAAVLEDIARALESSEGIERKGLIMSSLVKLKQVCDHPEILLKDNSGIRSRKKHGSVRSGKLVRLTEMLDEIIESNESAIVFTQFVEMGHLLRRHIEETLGCDVLFLHGSVPRKKRDELVNKFQNESGPKVFIISLKAGGTGLNLTAANHVFHFDRWWNPAVENQATDRAFRIGQKKNVQVHKMICMGTLEEKIDEMLELKKNISEKVISTGEMNITEMSNEEIYRIFALGNDAKMIEDV